MSVIDKLIYDRTAEDVARWEHLKRKGFASMSDEERTEWLSGMKGSYTPAIDMNRVGEAISYLVGQLQNHGYAVAVSPKTDWLESDIPTPEQLQEYLSNVSALHAVLDLFPDTPDVPADMEGLTIREANAIEKILADVDTLLTNMAAAWFYSGEIYSGEV